MPAHAAGIAVVRKRRIFADSTSCHADQRVASQLQPRVHGLAFQGQHAKYALVYPAQWLAGYEALQAFYP